MCMLSYIPEGIMPKTAELWNGADSNPDGHGWAMVNARSRTISVHKSMNPDEAIDTFMTAREKDASGPAIFHSRIATSGRVDITGCHPFTVGTDHRTVVGHNGILFYPEGARSDTRVFAEDIMPIRFANLDRSKTMRKLERFCGPSNKLAILTVNPIRRRHGYIVNEDRGIWSSASGVWHSNSDYMGWKFSYKKYDREGAADVKSYSYLWSGDSETAPWDKPGEPPWDTRPADGMSPWPCDVCGKLDSVDHVTMWCNSCGSCNDCYASQYECMCWLPPEDRANAIHSQNIALESPRQPMAIER